MVMAMKGMTAVQIAGVYEFAAIGIIAMYDTVCLIPVDFARLHLDVFDQPGRKLLF